MKEIPLTQGKVALVDDEDYDYLMQWKWYALVNNSRKSIYAQGKRKNESGFMEVVLMHRLIMKTFDKDRSIFVDHRDGNGINNQKSNLRICTNLQNQGNRKTAVNNKSGFRGVHLVRGKFFAQITMNQKRVYLGTFNDATKAAKAYNEAAINHFGEFASLNPL